MSIKTALMTHVLKDSRSTLAGASASLARHLRDRPLGTLDELRACAQKLATTIEKDKREYLWELVELVRIAHKAMAEFHEFTHELTILVDEVAREHRNTANARDERCGDSRASAGYRAEPGRARHVAAAGRSTK